MLNDGWIEWAGGECPVPSAKSVEVEFVNGTKGKDFPKWWVWYHNGEDDDIIAYRVIEE